MKRFILLAISGIALLVIGCGDEGGVMAPSEEGISPAGKLTMSGVKAGGYIGRLGLMRVHEMERQAMKARDPETWAALFAEDAVINYVPAGAVFEGSAGAREFLEGLFVGFPDYECIGEKMYMRGNFMVTEHTTLGTNEGEWMGLPGTGTGGPPHQHIDVWEFKGNKVAKLATYMDSHSLLVGLGIMPVPEAPELAPSFELPAPEPTGFAPRKAAMDAEERWDAHDTASYAKILHPDGVFQFAAMGMMPMDREAYIGLTEAFFRAFPDVYSDVRYVDLGDGWVLTEGSWIGTNTGPYFDVPATGNQVVIRAALLARYEDGMIVELRDYYDDMGMLAQLGLVPTQ